MQLLIPKTFAVEFVLNINYLPPSLPQSISQSVSQSMDQLIPSSVTPSSIKSVTHLPKGCTHASTPSFNQPVVNRNRLTCPSGVSCGDMPKDSRPLKATGVKEVEVATSPYCSRFSALPLREGTRFWLATKQVLAGCCSVGFVPMSSRTTRK